MCYAIYILLCLNNLLLHHQVIKKKTWGLNQNLSLSLEYGSIEKFNVQVPWLQLHTGQVNVFVDTVVLIFRVNVLDHDKDGVKSNDNFTQDLKMVSVARHKAILPAMLFLRYNLFFLLVVHLNSCLSFTRHITLYIPNRVLYNAFTPTTNTGTAEQRRAEAGRGLLGSCQAHRRWVLDDSLRQLPAELHHRQGHIQLQPDGHQVSYFGVVWLSC